MTRGLEDTPQLLTLVVISFDEQDAKPCRGRDGLWLHGHSNMGHLVVTGEGHGSRR